MILPAATCSTISRYASRSSSAGSTKFEWPRIERPLSRIEPDVSVASGPADCPSCTIRALPRRGVDGRASRRAPERIDHEVGPSPPHASRNLSMRSSPSSTTVASAPSSSARSSFARSRPAATMRSAPSRPRGLERHRADGSRRPRYEHAIARLDGRPPRQAPSPRRLRSHTRQRGRRRRRPAPVWPRLREVHALREEPVAGDAEAVAEEVGRVARRRGRRPRSRGRTAAADDLAGSGPSRRRGRAG